MAEDLSYNELQEYFQSDKSNWDEEQSFEFWKLLKQYKIDKNDLIFKHFEFPKNIEGNIFTQDDSYWVNEETKRITTKVVFENCYFNDDLFFRDITFENNFEVTDTAFENRLTFLNCHFENFYIDSSYFLKGLEFFGYNNGIKFNKELSISNSFFYSYLSLDNTTVNSKFNIENSFVNIDFHIGNSKLNTNDICSIKNIYKINLKNIKPKLHLKLEYLCFNLRYGNSDNFSFDHLKNKKEISYKLAKDYLVAQTIYPEISKSINNEVIKCFRDLFYRKFEKLPPLINISDTKFSKNFNFTKIDFSRASLKNLYLDSVLFHNCKWVIKNGRIILKDEKNNEKDYQNTYRELKRNFDNLKHWEFSGFAYVSEMEMRKKILLTDKKYISWLFYQFYYLFAGYTQNFLKPFYWFLFFNFLFFPLVYFFIEKIDFFNSLQISISNSLPLIKSLLKTKFWWIGTLQIILSSTLLTFFILALRKRFKQ